MAEIVPILEAPADAIALLSALGGSATFQTFDDTDAKRRDLSKVLHGSLQERLIELRSLNARSAGVFIMVNEGDGRGRKAHNVTRVRAYFADLDGAPVEPVYSFALKPHFIIESSPGRWHAYWLVSDAPLNEFRQVQRAIASRFDADPKVQDLPRVMRLPGFVHHKGSPFVTRIVSRHAASPYTHEQVTSALSLKDVDRKVSLLPGQIPDGARNDTLFRAALGFVQQGLAPHEVNMRLQRINAERCQPPLCASEVDGIAASAMDYGSSGFTIMPHKLLDSAEWRALPPAAHTIVLRAFRRYNGSNNGNIALPWSEFEGTPGFGKKGTFYHYRSMVIGSGILRQTEQGRNARQGRRPDLFAIDQRWLKKSPVPKKSPGPSTQKVHPYIDKQSLHVEGSSEASGQLRRVGGEP